jgi:hypothetical protein
LIRSMIEANLLFFSLSIILLRFICRYFYILSYPIDTS